jgi:hypothetical protein
MADVIIATSKAPASSRAECIESMAQPTSTVAMPRRAAVIGPTVDPHGRLLRLTKTCQGTLARSHADVNDAAVVASVA